MLGMPPLVLYAVASYFYRWMILISTRPPIGRLDIKGLNHES